ncbi:MAG: hypothetical protein HZC01_05215 [Candidatus Kerfeldbacteria bacterium]|nr:hypothetical protein [Candidatus Kerfeldbacteria bacterium]
MKSTSATPISKPVNEPEIQNNFLTVREVLQHLFIMIILWSLLYFEIQFILEILDRWADPFYSSNLFTTGGRLSEMIAFALLSVMSLYTVGVTLLFFSDLMIKRYRNVNYHRYIRMNTVVITSFVVYWALFVSFFIRL